MLVLWGAARRARPARAPSSPHSLALMLLSSSAFLQASSDRLAESVLQCLRWFVALGASCFRLIKPSKLKPRTPLLFAAAFFCVCVPRARARFLFSVFSRLAQRAAHRPHSKRQQARCAAAGLWLWLWALCASAAPRAHAALSQHGGARVHVWREWRRSGVGWCAHSGRRTRASSHRTAHSPVRDSHHRQTHNTQHTQSTIK